MCLTNYFHSVLATLNLFVYWLWSHEFSTVNLTLLNTWNTLFLHYLLLFTSTLTEYWVSSKSDFDCRNCLIFLQQWLWWLNVTRTRTQMKYWLWQNMIFLESPGHCYFKKNRYISIQNIFKKKEKIIIHW